jgi:predicted protein tyrosine phosphatase
VRCQPDSGSPGGAGVRLRLLFVCSRNRLRSPTAEAIFASLEGVEVASAGTAPDAECPVSADLIEWADEIFVMEQRHKRVLRTRFSGAIQGKRLICLGIPDRCGFMQDELVILLRNKVLPMIGEKKDR